MFNDGPCNGKSVKCAGSAADFIQYKEAVSCSVTQDISHLGHFNHKCTLSACKVIRCADSCENPVTYTYICFFGRNIGTCLCHKYYKRCLPHISRFTCHIWTGNYWYAVFVIIKICIVWYKHVVGNHFFNNRMSSAYYVNNTFFVNWRTYIIILLRYECKRSKNINSCNCPCGILYTDNLWSNSVSDFRKYIVFQSEKFIFRPKNYIFKFFKFWHCIALCIGKCLFAYIIIRNHIFERVCNFKIISEDFVVFNAQCFYARPFALWCL